jgi:hypothetical protein
VEIFTSPSVLLAMAEWLVNKVKKMVTTQPLSILPSYTRNLLGMDGSEISKSIVKSTDFVLDGVHRNEFNFNRRWRLKPQLLWSKVTLRRLVSSNQRESTQVDFKTNAVCPRAWGCLKSPTKDYWWENNS